MSATTLDIPPPAWLTRPALARLLAALEADGEEARAIGGAVRNELMALPIKDIDIGTTLAPERVMARAAAAGFKTVPTGLAHGTVTVVVDGAPVEVTTLRRDVATFGRHAEVAFTRDWAEDARRRDLTVNALSLSAAGRIHDYVGGIEDCRTRRIRFIGDPRQRIREDYLRILRFFRIHAAYGHGPVDAAGLAAATAERAGLGRLSAERIAHELVRLLMAPGAVGAVQPMVANGILSAAIPGPFDVIALERAILAQTALAAAEPTLDPSPAAAEVRLAALAAAGDTARTEALAGTLKLSTAARRRMARAIAARADVSGPDAAAVRRLVWRHGLSASLDGLVLTAAAGRPVEEATAALAPALAFHRAAPACPVTAAMLIAEGIARPGPGLGRTLRWLEDLWIESDFQLAAEDLLAEARRRPQGGDGPVS